MRDKVLRFCREEALIRPGDAVVCAVSGGADSMAMLWCLHSLREELGIAVSVAHFNHRLRGEESDGDEAFVREFCEKNGISLTCGSGDVAAYAEAEGLSVETAARELRYSFFAELDGLVATAHTADDNAETVLMNLLRGAGLRGLSGIPPRRGTIIRPLLSVTREDVLLWLRASDIPWREDSTNGADDCRRNRIRHHVIPLLKEENPAFSRTVLAECRILREENEFLEKEAEEEAARIRRQDGYDLEQLRRLPKAMLRRVLICLCRQQEIPADLHHTELLCSLVDSPDSVGQTGLPDGWRAVRAYGLLRFEREAVPPLGTYSLEVPGRLYIPELSMEISAVVSETQVSPQDDTILLDAALLTAPITVRARKTGDRLALSGGHRSLKRLMIDRKVPAHQRDRLPVLAMGETVLAVYPLGVGRDYTPKPGKRVLAVQFKTYR